MMKTHVAVVFATCAVATASSWFDDASFTPSPSDIEKMVCKVVGNKFMEGMMTRTACFEVHQLLGITIPDCHANAEKLWDMVGKMCQEAPPSPSDMEKMVCKALSNKNIEDAVTRKACTTIPQLLNMTKMMDDKHIEDMVTSKACTTIPQLLNMTIPDCQAKAEKLWEMVAKLSSVSIPDCQVKAEKLWNMLAKLWIEAIPGCQVEENFVNAAEDVINGGTLKLSWSNCGSTHAKVTDVKPDTLQLGQKTVVTGSGSTDMAVAAASATVEIKYGWFSKTYPIADACSPMTVQAPLGSMTFEGLKCPLAAGAVSVTTDIQLSGAIPAFMATADIKLQATAPNGDKLLCLDIATAPSLEAKAAPEQKVTKEIIV